jgi:predicted nucleotidyltransferase
VKRKGIKIEELKEDLLSVEKLYNEVLAIGICGSLARGECHQRSDIDIFIVIPKERWHKGVQEEWYYRLHDLLYKKYYRGITVFVYTPELLKKVPCWATLNMVTEAILVLDKADISSIFKRIIKKAEEVGLVLKKVGRYQTWVMARPMKPGEIIHLEV